MQFLDTFDVIVVGGGHAGTEAALASARLGARTLLLTQSIETLGQLSCNPSIGGIGKSQLVKEIDALGGAMAFAADQASIHWRLLNASKGPAVRATRVQVDRQLYKQSIRLLLETQEQLTIFEQPVVDLILQGDTATGVVTQLGMRFFAKTIVLTAGTFLNGKIHVGLNHYTGGRMGEAASVSLANRFKDLPFRMGRLKTGTPPRIDGRTIDYNHLQEQPSEFPLPLLSWKSTKNQVPCQKSCFMTRTDQHTHAIIQENLANSPLYSGEIQGIGPRYCPSIEDKIMRFSHRPSHQIMLEPESLNTGEVYPNGLSTSLPFEVQIKLVRSLPGLKDAHITRPGYAIEYDFFDPRDLSLSLESQIISGLFCAGQINGTTGYEEAAAQGLIAGLNAGLKAQNKSAWYPRRDQAYMGVLIDDLVTRGTLEPYRMFTSRAEYRLLLREDNADLRLTQIGFELGLVGTVQWNQVAEKIKILNAEKQKLSKTYVYPNTSAANNLSPFLQHPITTPVSLMRLLMQPKIQYATLMDLAEVSYKMEDPVIQAQLKVQAQYSGYIERQEEEVAKQLRYEKKLLPKTMDYQNIPGLSHEIREILLKHQPKTVGQALRLSGMTRAAISILLIYLKRPEMSA